jgi:hypothetical protein
MFDLFGPSAFSLAEAQRNVANQMLGDKLGVEVKGLTLSGGASWPRPIPVSERLPDWVSPFLLYCAADDDSVGEWVAACRSRDGELYEYGGNELHGTPTHWLPLPPKPPAASPSKTPGNQDSDSSSG